jgi:hypothetical protein
VSTTAADVCIQGDIMTDQQIGGRHDDGPREDHEDNHRVPKELTIHIDGRRFSINDDRQTAAELLHLAGLDPARYDLGEIEHGKTTRYEDDRPITLHEGEKFVSIRQEAPVA